MFMTPSTMELKVTLILSCLLFSTAVALQCYQCMPNSSGSCENTTALCPFQCGSMTTTITTSNVSMNFTLKDCMLDAECVSGSVHLTKQIAVNINTECCTTNLCNKETLPAQMNQAPNGLMCSTCAGGNCTLDCQGGHCSKNLEIMECIGNEDRCIIATDNVLGPMEGCATKSVCNSNTLQQLLGLKNVQCCKGNQCNAAESFTLSFLLMLIPLLSSILFN